MRRLGIPPRTAEEQLQRTHPTAKATEPLPKCWGAPPYRVSTADLEIPAADKARAFHVIGDSGGVKDPNPQLAVAKAMTNDLLQNPDVGFAYHVGDVVYFNGQETEYGPQFFEPYADYLRHVVAIPGNHDTEPLPGEEPLAGFVRYFCTEHPEVRPEVEEYHTDTMTQPNVYWTLEDDFVTVVGLATNSPSGGVVEADQAEWLAGEISHAPTDRPLIVALHHPPYSADAHHGGSAGMGKMLDRAFINGGRFPTMILAGHVHNYQRFTRTIDGHTLTYVVCGASGYHHLHLMAKGAKEGEALEPGVVLDAFEDRQYGFLRLRTDRLAIAGEYVGVAKDGTVTRYIDKFNLTV